MSSYLYTNYLLWPIAKTLINFAKLQELKKKPSLQRNLFKKAFLFIIDSKSFTAETTIARIRNKIPKADYLSVSKGWLYVIFNFKNKLQFFCRCLFLTSVIFVSIIISITRNRRAPQTGNNMLVNKNGSKKSITVEIQMRTLKGRN